MADNGIVFIGIGIIAQNTFLLHFILLETIFTDQYISVSIDFELVIQNIYYKNIVKYTGIMNTCPPMDASVHMNTYLILA